MKKVGGIWSHIIFCQILFGKFAGSGAIIFRRILFEGADEKVGGIWSHIIFRQILFEGAEVKVGGIWSHNLPSDSF